MHTNFSEMATFWFRKVLPKLLKIDRGTAMDLTAAIYKMQRLPKFLLEEMEGEVYLKSLNLPFPLFILDYTSDDTKHVVLVRDMPDSVKLEAYTGYDGKWSPPYFYVNVVKTEKGFGQLELFLKEGCIEEAEKEIQLAFAKSLYQLHLVTLVKLLGRLSCSNVSIGDAPKPKAKKGQRLTARLDNTYKVLNIITAEQVASDQGHQEHQEHQEHQGRQPREHIRRGHACRQPIKGGHKLIWRNAVIVNKGIGGVLVKDYKVK